MSNLCVCVSDLGVCFSDLRLWAKGLLFEPCGIFVDCVQFVCVSNLCACVNCEKFVCVSIGSNLCVCQLCQICVCVSVSSVLNSCVCISDLRVDFCIHLIREALMPLLFSECVFAFDFFLKAFLPLLSCEGSFR